MNHVRVTTITGQEVEIPHEEALRISHHVNPHKSVDSFHQRVKERNEHYLKKACTKIREIAEKHGYSDLHGTEDEYKQLLSDKLGDDIGDLIVEIIEQRIAHHHQEIYSE